MCRSAWEAPWHTGLQPAALCSLERGALGRGEARARPRRGWGVNELLGRGPGQQQDRVGRLVLHCKNRSWEVK